MSALRLGIVAAVICIAMALAVMGVTAAQAQGAPCWPRDVLLGQLAGTYGETQRGIGLVAQDQVLEIYAAEATGTFTIIVTQPDGLSCMIASGQGYEAVDGVLPPPGEDG